MYLRYQPTNALNLSISPSIDWNDNSLQYVDSYTTDTENYVLGRINQVTYSASARVNYIITPNLSLEYWGQPFISRGEYSDFKKVLNPGAGQFEDRYQPFSSEEISFNSLSNEYLIDEDQNGTAEFALGDPNFNFLQFRSNLVLRWEYVPGSTLFVVWTSNATDSHQSRSNEFSHLASDLGNINATNIFLIKYTYRFIL